MHVFVYGTLKRGYGNNRVLGDSTFLTEATLPGFKLYHAGFPVACRDADGKIKGEIWDIGDNETVLRNLDRLEGEGRMYHRETEEVEDFGEVSLYVGHSDFWNFHTMDACPTDDNGTYVWSR